MPISEVSFEELLIVFAIMVPFLTCLHQAEGNGTGPSVRGLRIKKRR